MRSLILTLVASSLVSGCGRQAPNCGFLEGGYALLHTNLSRLSDIPASAVAPGVRRAVEQCYPTHPYWDYRGPFDFIGAKRSKDGHTYLIYEPQGITDVWLVFEVGNNAQPLKAFTYSTL